MAHFLKSSASIGAGNTAVVTMWGGGPPPKNDRLTVSPENGNIVSVQDDAQRLGPEYDTKVTGKFPGRTNLNAFLPGTNIKYSAPMEIIVTGRIKIDFSANGEGTLECVGLGTFNILGQPGRKYPKDIVVDPTIDATEKEQNHKSVEFGVDMPWAIRIWGQKGIYIHEMPDNLSANGGPSAGCVHVGPTNAKKVYDYVIGRTRITIKYPW